MPVTVIQALPNRVTQVKGVEGDGYRAIQVTFGSRKRPACRSLAGHYAKAKVEPGESLVEFRLADGEGRICHGRRVQVDMFAAGQKVDVTGTTIGKGFAGTIKRHNFAGGPGLARRLGVPPGPGFHRPAPDAGPRVPASACRATWASSGAPSRTCASSRSTPNATCC